jgi:hypothetical protein
LRNSLSTEINTINAVDLLRTCCGGVAQHFTQQKLTQFLTVTAMNYRQMCSHLKALNYQFDRQCRGSHELWRHPTKGVALVTRCGLTNRGGMNWRSQLQRVHRRQHQLTN